MTEVIGPYLTKPLWRLPSARLVLDFANILKTFIGSNFLGMPYAFRQAGVYVRGTSFPFDLCWASLNFSLQGGLVGILIIAWVTDHCCKLLIHCKNSLPNAAYVLPSQLRSSNTFARFISR